MEQPSAPEPPDAAPNALPIPPLLTPEYRLFLNRINMRRISAEAVLEMYFRLCEGNSQDRGCANDLLGCLVDPSAKRGYMDLVWMLARSWSHAAHGRYEECDLVASTGEEIVKALSRPSGRQVLTNGWHWLCRNSFQRAREQAALNGDEGYKSISARAVKDAQKQIARLQGPESDGTDSDAYLDDGDDQVDEEAAEMAVESASPGGKVHYSATTECEIDFVSWEDDGDEDTLKAEGLDRHRIANDMAHALHELSPNTNYATYAWLQAFVEEYREQYISTLEDPDQRAVAEAILDDAPTSRDAKLDRPPLLETLDLTRDRINILKKRERTRFHAALVRAAEKSGVVDDDFVELVLQHMR